MALLPRRALYLLAEYLGIKLNGRTCRAHTSKGKICKHKRPNGQLFCTTHNNSYSLKVGIQKSLHICRGSQMKFGEYLAIFGETIKTEKLRWPALPKPDRFLKAREALRLRKHATEHIDTIKLLGPVRGCLCYPCIRVRHWAEDNNKHYCVECITMNIEKQERKKKYGQR